MQKHIAAILLSSAVFTGIALAQTPPSNTTPPTVLRNQTPNEERSSKIVGLGVYNTAGDQIGSVEDLIIDPNGQVATAVIGVGGFLGVGEKNVGINFKSLQFSRDNNGNLQAKLDTTKDALKAAPSFTYYRAS